MLSFLPARQIVPLLHRGIFALIFCGAITTAFAADDEPRFSNTLTSAQRTEVGFAQLSDDNIAVIDALVRADEATLRRRGQAAMPPGNFSQRRSAHETEITGLAKLTTEQRNRLDALIALRTAPITQLTAEVGAPATPARPMVERNTRPQGLEVHGSVSLTYGWSKGGNVRGGEMVVTATDPSRRMAITVGYSEYRGKGLVPYYDPYDEFSRYRPIAPAPNE
jgi:hypothetical protein